ncbi:MAG: helix-turn-helix domain-containing protein [Nitrospirota bacterium]|nr:helix-turn-helix domain-containing protein [Nitrospirota bacterium]
MATEQPINLNIGKRLKEDHEFRKSFFRALSRNEIAAQIIKLRKMRNMRQSDLADAVDTGQSAISRLEKADYASWNYQTLLGIAEALQARLHIQFEPVENAIAQYGQQEESILDKFVTGDTLFTTEERHDEYALVDLAKSQENVCLSTTEQQPHEYSV